MQGLQKISYMLKLCWISYMEVNFHVFAIHKATNNLIKSALDSHIVIVVVVAMLVTFEQIH